MDKPESWLNIAERDLESAKVLLSHHKPLIENTCYHCQQCAEKSLKAFLCLAKKDNLLTHNLSVLCRECIKTDVTFQELKPHAKYLTQFATRTRYEDCSDITKEMGKLAVQRAEEVLEFVINIINSSETPPKS